MNWATTRNQSEIARSCVVARSTVQDYIRRATAKGVSYAQVSQLSDSEAQALLGKGQRARGATLEAVDFAPVHQELQRKGVTLALLWQEGIDQQSWSLSYGQFCRRYTQWKGRQTLSMRQTHTAGDKVFVDYCGQTVPVVHPETG